jgi:hypothetical protein
MLKLGFDLKQLALLALGVPLGCWVLDTWPSASFAKLITTRSSSLCCIIFLHDCSLFSQQHKMYRLTYLKIFVLFMFSSTFVSLFIELGPSHSPCWVSIFIFWVKETGLCLYNTYTKGENKQKSGECHRSKVPELCAQREGTGWWQWSTGLPVEGAEMRWLEEDIIFQKWEQSIEKSRGVAKWDWLAFGQVPSTQHPVGSQDYWDQLLQLKFQFKHLVAVGP